MIYKLTCGQCLTDSKVSGSDVAISWVCANCGNDNNSSIPTTLAGAIITDYTKATAILSPTDAAAAKDVVIGKKPVQVGIK